MATSTDNALSILSLILETVFLLLDLMIKRPKSVFNTLFVSFKGIV